MFPLASLAKTDAKGRLKELTVRPEAVGAVMVEGSQMSVKFNVTGSTAAGTLGPETRVKPDASTSKVRSMVAACAIEVNAAKAAPATKAWNFIVAPKQLSDGCAAKLTQSQLSQARHAYFLSAS